MRSPSPLLVALLASLVLAACTTVTGTRASGSHADIAALTRVAAVVHGPAGLSVQRDRQRMTAAGALRGGLLGAAIESGARANSDTSFARTLEPALGEFDGIAVLRERLLATLRARRVFPATESTRITDVAAMRAGGFDALLDVQVPEWGLRLCGTPSDDMQVMYRAHGRLLTSGTAAPLWERHEVFVDAECRTAAAWRHEVGLLRAALTRAADEFARRLVNDLLFP
jgi:hypothetical protein